MLIKEEVHKWQVEGANIVYRHRVLRDGYKAGNLKSAMSCSYVKDYEFVAIFDADFQPSPDFLKRTVIHFKVIFKLNYSFIIVYWLYYGAFQNLYVMLLSIYLGYLMINPNIFLIKLKCSSIPFMSDVKGPTRILELKWSVTLTWIINVYWLKFY